MRAHGGADAYVIALAIVATPAIAAAHNPDALGAAIVTITIPALAIATVAALWVRRRLREQPRARLVVPALVFVSALPVALVLLWFLIVPVLYVFFGG